MTENSREHYAAFDDTELDEALNGIWAERERASAQAALVIAEMISRLIVQHIPNAARVVLVEDRSHGAPHGHVRDIFDGDGAHLISGRGDDWHNLDWSHDVDEHVHDLHYLASQVFSYDADLQERVYAFDTKPDAASRDES